MAADTPPPTDASQPGPTTWPELLTTLLQGSDLTLAQARWAMDEVMSGNASPVQLAGFLVALRAKGESVDELRGLADVMFEHARRIEVAGPTLDIVGTGGDRQQSVNISTMSSVVIAASGIRVVKHGNRAASSRSGSADVLEELGVDLGLPPERVAAVAQEAGITFCFAQAFHPSMRFAAEARTGLAVATVFNMLGPLTNPAAPTYAAVGVADASVAPLMAGVFAGRRSESVVFRGDDGLDEMTISTTSSMWWVRGGQIHEHSVAPEDVGLERHPLEALRGADPAHNADVARRVLAGETGAVRDAVLLNAGTALALARTDCGTDRDGMVEALRAGVEEAGRTIDSGAATARLERWAAATRAAAPGQLT